MSRFDTVQCPFCKRDPFEYVDIGVGYEAVAVSCCDAGIGLFQYHEPFLRKMARYLASNNYRQLRLARRLMLNRGYP